MIVKECQIFKKWAETNQRRRDWFICGFIIKILNLELYIFGSSFKQKVSSRSQYLNFF